MITGRHGDLPLPLAIGYRLWAIGYHRAGFSRVGAVSAGVEPRATGAGREYCERDASRPSTSLTPDS
jgi:hypothetical protein